MMNPELRDGNKDRNLSIRRKNERKGISGGFAILLPLILSISNL